jgi:hypothetical protein
MNPDIKAYTAVMNEIKRRTEVVFALHRNELTVKYKATQIETTILQVRMILELVALASLASHRSLFEQQQKKFSSYWDPVRVLKDVESLNPNFYPKPIIERPSKTGGIVNDIEDKKSGFMTRDELIEIHGRCGNVLHARNPYAKALDYASYERSIPNWMKRIIGLLDSHTIQMYGDSSRFYLVHMREDQDDHVHMYTFQQVDVAANKRT